ncbi:MAG: DNA polymerase III subunit gamma/tau [Candidatus Binataceae bacterium]
MAESSPSHLVLARKWRPERFSELVGQEHVTRTLSEALKRGRIAHAFLFTGIRGVGKTTAARILARCLNCERGPTPEPCGECVVCVEIRAGRALDVSEIDGATYRKIDDARAIIENLSYRPARDRFKIYIIDEAHQLTDQAFNALLKTLEEPPAHVKFILATTEPQKMPETILSRLQRYDFRRIPFATIFERLRELASREETAADDAALRLIAREAGGSMRDGERMLETAIASWTEGRVTEAEVASALGVAARTTVFKIIEAILDHSAAPALRLVRELAARGANLQSLGRDLLETLRNLAVAKLPTDGGQSPLDELPDHEAQELRRIAAGATSRDLMRLFRLMADSQEEIIRSPYPDLLLEMAVVRMASLAPVVDADELLRAIGAAGNTPAAPPRGPAPSSSSSSGGGGARSAPTESPASARRIPVKGEVKADAPLRAPAVAPGAGQSAPLGPDLPELRDHIRSRRAALAGFMEQGAALALAGDTLTVFPRNDIYVRYLADNRAMLAELASEFFGRAVRVELAPAGTPAPALPPDATITNSMAPPPAAESAAPDVAPRQNGSPATAPQRTAASSADERAEIYSDPAMRRIFDAFEARLVEVRAPRDTKAGG